MLLPVTTPRPTGDADFDAATCRRFIAATTGRETPPLLRRAMALAGGGGRALELGCGAGDDAVAIAAAGYAVTVVDEFADAIAAARSKLEAAGLADRATLVESAFESFAFPAAAHALVHARFSLPFCDPACFDRVWRDLGAALAPGGIFAGELFGPRDTFVADPARRRIVGHDHAAVRALAAGFEILEHEEEEKDGHTATGRAKHWHVHHLLLRRLHPGTGIVGSPPNRA